MTDRDAPERLVLVQGLANTRDVGKGEDTLVSAADVAAFAARLGLTGLGLTGRDAAALRELREALRAACLAHTGRDMSVEASAALERRLSAAPMVLTADGAGQVRLRPAAGLSGIAAFTARVAVGVAEAQADGSWHRLKACEAHDCQWVYYDRSPAGRSRWCSMAVCGSRAKMRSYRARNRH